MTNDQAARLGWNTRRNAKSSQNDRNYAKKLSGFGANWHCLNSKHNNRRAPTTHAHTLSPHKQQKTRGIYISTYNTSHPSREKRRETNRPHSQLYTTHTKPRWFSHFQLSIPVPFFTQRKGKEKSEEKT